MPFSVGDGAGLLVAALLEVVEDGLSFDDWPQPAERPTTATIARNPPTSVSCRETNVDCFISCPPTPPLTMTRKTYLPAPSRQNRSTPLVERVSKCSPNRTLRDSQQASRQGIPAGRPA